jgi:hypothetical protein
MAKFCKFQSERGETVHINPDLVRAVWERAADKFALVFGDDHQIGVVGSRDEVIRKLEEAK